jgi:hypothetical protein
MRAGIEIQSESLAGIHAVNWKRANIVALLL